MSGTRKKCAAAWLWLTCAVLVVAPAYSQPIANVTAQNSTNTTEEDDSVAARFISTSLAWQPPAVGIPSLSTPNSATANANRSARPAMNRLASAPEMFGDYFQSGGNVNFGPNDLGGSANQSSGSFTIPSAGGSRHVKVGENNKALPADRFIFSYSHFQNALQFSEQPIFGGGATTALFPIDRYTFGVEKTFLDGTWSCEIRMPFSGDFDFQGNNISGNGGRIGNLALILKHLLYLDEKLAVVAGMGIDTPTGSNFVLTDNIAFPTNQLTFQNDALHLLPYAGFLLSGDRPYYINAFVQVDVATAGNRIESGPAGGPVTQLGLYNEQNLLFVDFGTGYWLFRDDINSGLTSLAAIWELHYTSTLQNTDVVAGDAGGRAVVYQNNFNRFDVLNMTVGFQAQYNVLTSLRVACVVPLGTADDDRFFDSEIQVQINRRF